jgi:hypothetical protein
LIHAIENKQVIHNFPQPSGDLQGSLIGDIKGRKFNILGKLSPSFMVTFHRLISSSMILYMKSFFRNLFGSYHVSKFEIRRRCG